jgi:hypothetical protein
MPRIRPALVVALLGALALGALVLRHGLPSSGLSDGDRRIELRKAARSLVSPSWRELESEDGACVELAAYPSCLTVLFVRAGQPRETSADTVRRAATAAGWEATDDVEGRTQTMLSFRRGQLTAWVAMRDDAATTCGGRTFSDCSSYADELHVILP